mmetsp:Transcript_12203/g.42316  ORF Transcript_12203/g.42316 Transcript_12203/m.42316 type:complete len:225 (+) Transcript_12203:347-1021(+)
MHPLSSSASFEGRSLASAMRASASRNSVKDMDVYWFLFLISSGTIIWLSEKIRTSSFSCTPSGSLRWSSLSPSRFVIHIHSDMVASWKSLPTMMAYIALSSLAYALKVSMTALVYSLSFLNTLRSVLATFALRSRFDLAYLRKPPSVVTGSAPSAAKANAMWNTASRNSKRRNIWSGLASFCFFSFLLSSIRLSSSKSPVMFMKPNLPPSGTSRKPAAKVYSLN